MPMPGDGDADAPFPASSLDPPERPGHQVVLGLFAVLALCVVFIFTIFSLSVRPEDRGWVPEVTARYLYMPVVATSLIIAIDAYRHRRSGWWIYLVTAPVPVVNVALAAAWLLRWRKTPRVVGRWTL